MLAITRVFHAELDHGYARRAGVACLFDRTTAPTRIVIGQHMESQIVLTTIADGGLL